MTIKLLKYLTLISILLVIVICYPSGLYFLNDDFVHIPASARGNFFQTSLIRPLQYISVYIDAMIWDKNATGFHLTNLVLHISNVILIYFLTKNLFIKYSNQNENPNVFSISVTLLFLCYSFHSESIFWVIARDSSLAALFIQLSLILFLFKNKTAYSGIFSIVFFTIGLFTYESVWVVPAIITILALSDKYFKKSNLRQALIWPGFFWLTFFAYLVFRFVYNGTLLGDYEGANIKNIYIWKLLYNYTATFARCFLPPMKSGITFLGATLVLFVFMLLFFIRLILKKGWEKLKLLILILSCCFVSILPTISLGIDTHDTESERFIYAPSIFICILIVELIRQLVASINVQVSLIMLLSILHIAWLYKAAKTYRVASQIAYQTINHISDLPTTDTLTAINVPTQYKGALIFREGFFKPAIQWMMPNKFKNLIITNYQEVFKVGIFCQTLNKQKADTAKNIIITWKN